MLAEGEEVAAGGTADITHRYADNHLPHGACPRHGWRCNCSMGGLRWALFSGAGLGGNGDIMATMQYQHVAARDVYWSSATLSPCCWSFTTAGIWLKITPRLLAMLGSWAIPQLGSQPHRWVAGCFWYSATTRGPSSQHSSSQETGIYSRLKMPNSHGTTAGFFDQQLAVTLPPFLRNPWFQPFSAAPPPALPTACPGAAFQQPCRKLLICSRWSNTAKLIS